MLLDLWPAAPPRCRRWPSNRTVLLRLDSVCFGCHGSVAMHRTREPAWFDHHLRSTPYDGGNHVRSLPSPRRRHSCSQTRRPSCGVIREPSPRHAALRSFCHCVGNCRGEHSQRRVPQADRTHPLRPLFRREDAPRHAVSTGLVAVGTAGCEGRCRRTGPEALLIHCDKLDLEASAKHRSGRGHDRPTLPPVRPRPCSCMCDLGR